MVTDHIPHCLVFDASPLINIIATDIPQVLLGAYDVPAKVMRPTFEEITRDPRGRPIDTVMTPFVASGALEVIESSPEIDRAAFARVSAPSPDDLDEGEAYAIALALSLKDACLIVDERKARRILAQDHPEQPLMGTVDLFLAARARALVPIDVLRQAVDDAKTYARAHLPRGFSI